MTDFKMRRAAALAILQRSERLTPNSGRFLGQLVADSTPLTEKQAKWFDQLAEQAGVEVGHE